MVIRDEGPMRARNQADARRLPGQRQPRELRTPLASLAGFVETLRGHARDDARAPANAFLGVMAAQAVAGWGG